MIRHLYVHIPFCLNKCGYCSFYSVIDNEREKKNYLKHLLAEITLYSQRLKIKPYTIYFGGGTPSLLSPDQIRSVFDLLDVSELKECTIEINPATVDEYYLKDLLDSPINRVSIGTQSFIDKELISLGRLHDAADNFDCYNACRKAGFQNISLDFIYGLHGQTKEDLKTNLKIIKELNPEHVSTYCLSIEEGTPFERTNYKTPDDDTVSDFYSYIIESLTESGYEHYEISSFAKEGYMSQHNLSYWRCSEYLGVGASAHSHLNNMRFANHSDLDKYYETVRNNELYPNCEKQDDEMKRKDFIVQSMRLSSGLNIPLYNKLFGDDFKARYQKQLSKYKNFLVLDDGNVHFTSEAFFVSNEILADFL